MQANMASVFATTSKLQCITKAQVDFPNWNANQVEAIAVSYQDRLIARLPLGAQLIDVIDLQD
jgi:hypothetical protein